MKTSEEKEEKMNPATLSTMSSSFSEKKKKKKRPSKSKRKRLKREREQMLLQSPTISYSNPPSSMPSNSRSSHTTVNDTIKNTGENPTSKHHLDLLMEFHPNATFQEYDRDAHRWDIYFNASKSMTGLYTFAELPGDSSFKKLKLTREEIYNQCGEYFLDQVISKSVYYMEYARRHIISGNDLACALRCFAETECKYSIDFEQEDDDDDGNDDDDLDTNSTDDGSNDCDSDEVNVTNDDKIDIKSDLAVYYGTYKEVQISNGIPVKHMIIDLKRYMLKYRYDYRFQNSVLKILKKAMDAFIVANFCAYSYLGIVD